MHTNNFNYVITLPRQQILLHASSWVLLPVQGSPPHEGMGLLHVLLYLNIPPPQLLLHLHRVHELHPP